jgi:hypothetical protein
MQERQAVALVLQRAIQLVELGLESPSSVTLAYSSRPARAESTAAAESPAACAAAIISP